MLNARVQASKTEWKITAKTGRHLKKKKKKKLFNTDFTNIYIYI